jgi:pimeloyl-ACP methyl ester carboxylesterase
LTEKKFIYENSPIFYRTIGEGKPVVLIHGFGEDGVIWENQVNFLKGHFRLIIPDLPGSGRSQLVTNSNIETYAAILKKLLDIECIQARPKEPEQVTMIGHSMGGYITLAFAEKYPQYLNSFGLFHSTAFEDSEEKKQVRAKAIDFIRDKGVNAFLKTSTPGLFTKAFAARFPEKISALVEKGQSFSPDALIQYYKAMIARPDRTAVLKTFLKPILFIMGEYDNAIPLQSSLQQCYLPVQSHVHLLEHSAHMGMWEEQDKSNKLLLNFLLHTARNPV